MRLNRKGHRITVRPGYGTPNQEKNKIQGLEIITITNIQELENVNPKTQCIVIGRTGKQKKLDLIKKAEEQKITIINLKVDKFKEATEKYFAERKKASKQRVEEQKKKEAEEQKKKEDKKEDKKDDKQEEISEEEKQKQEKKEKDKILTKNK